jgi:hypothetical protein
MEVSEYRPGPRVHHAARNSATAAVAFGYDAARQTRGSIDSAKPARDDPVAILGSVRPGALFGKVGA